MFCPNCGANNKIEQNFCRFCRFELRETGKSLSAQLSTGQDSCRLKKLEQIKKLSDAATIGLVGSIAAGIVVYVYTFLTGTTFSGGRIFFGLIAAFFIFESVMFYLRRANTLGYADELERKKNLARGENGQIENRETAKLIEDKPFEPVPASVAENTTRLLFAENKTNKLE